MKETTTSYYYTVHKDVSVLSIQSHDGRLLHCRHVNTPQLAGIELGLASPDGRRADAFVDEREITVLRDWLTNIINDRRKTAR